MGWRGGDERVKKIWWGVSGVSFECERVAEDFDQLATFDMGRHIY